MGTKIFYRTKRIEQSRKCINGQKPFHFNGLMRRLTLYEKQDIANTTTATTTRKRGKAQRVARPAPPIQMSHVIHMLHDLRITRPKITKFVAK